MTYDREDIRALADEYVLGLVGAREAAEIEAAMEGDAELRAAVSASRDRFLPLDMAVEPAVVDDTLWRQIEAALPTQGISGLQAPETATAAANDNRKSAWRATAISAIAAALMLSVGLAYTLTRPAEPVVVAVLINEAGEVQAVVEDFGNENATIRLLADFAVPADRAIQVWTLPSKDIGPVSLGLIEGTGSTHVAGPKLPIPHSDQLYEITLEQAGGSPTGRPTGPILAKGFAKVPR